MAVRHQTDIFIFIHIFITYITFIIFIINIICAALTADSLISAHFFLPPFLFHFFLFCETISPTSIKIEPETDTMVIFSSNTNIDNTTVTTGET